MRTDFHKMINDLQTEMDIKKPTGRMETVSFRLTILVQYSTMLFIGAIRRVCQY